MNQINQRAEVDSCESNQTEIARKREGPSQDKPGEPERARVSNLRESGERKVTTPMVTCEAARVSNLALIPCKISERKLYITLIFDYNQSLDYIALTPKPKRKIQSCL
ncbi:hypothetical protein CsSME_00012247 [Camellia sinensis var. sinensis]